jgi:hypothetical protein
VRERVYSSRPVSFTGSTRHLRDVPVPELVMISLIRGLDTHSGRITGNSQISDNQERGTNSWNDQYRPIGQCLQIQSSWP